jgi:GAF domain-containing protein
MAGTAENWGNAAVEWLERRVSAATQAAAQEFLRQTAESLSIASGDATGIRVLSNDGKRLQPLAVHHPSPEIERAMFEAIRRAPERADAGLWMPVIDERRTVVHQLTDHTVPPEASPNQAAFIRTYPLTWVMFTPVLLHDEVVGGVSLARFVDTRPFTEADGKLLFEVAARAASAIDFGSLRDLGPERLT